MGKELAEKLQRVNREIIKKRAYKRLEDRNYERICLIAGICPVCGGEAVRTIRNTEKSPVLEWKYICLSCEHTVEEWKLNQHLGEEIFISIIKEGVKSNASTS